MSMLTMTCETPLAHERQRGDIRISKAEVRVNAAGFGPDSDGLINATFDFTNAMSKSPMMPITSYEEAALYLFQAATASGDMGVMSGLTSVMNRVAAPYEVYVTFEYEIYVGERTGFSQFSLPRRIIRNRSSVEEKIGFMEDLFLMIAFMVRRVGTFLIVIQPIKLASKDCPNTGMKVQTIYMRG